MILAGALCVTATPPAMGRRDPKTPSRGVRVTTSGSTVRHTVNRAGKPRTPGRVAVNPGSVTCRRWTTIEMVVGGPPEKPVATTITHYWKQCFSTVTGRPTGPAREYDPGGGGVPPAAEEVWTAVVPDPVIQRENGVRFVTQRTPWVWLPPAYFRGITSICGRRLVNCEAVARRLGRCRCCSTRAGAVRVRVWIARSRRQFPTTVAARSGIKRPVGFLVHEIVARRARRRVPGESNGGVGSQRGCRRRTCGHGDGGHGWSGGVSGCGVTSTGHVCRWFPVVMSGHRSGTR